jgi:hypothetical protein
VPRIGNFSRDIGLIVDRHLSVEARQKIVAKKAREILAEAEAKNRAVLGETPPHKQIVDGRLGAPLESVNVEHGHITFEFDFTLECLRWIGEQLIINSPVRTGRFRDSIIMLADGVEIDPGEFKTVPRAQEYVFVSTVPYARKIERGLSDQAPEGVFEVVADLAKRRFGNIASIKYTLYGITQGNTMLEEWAIGHSSKEEGIRKQQRQYDKDVRNPAVVVKLY